MKSVHFFIALLACVFTGCSSVLLQQQTQAAVEQWLRGDAEASSPYERVIISADMVTFWPEAGDDSQPKTKLSDATYILNKKDGAWQLTEQSIRMGSGIHHINDYGAISEEEARSIITAACKLAQAETGCKGELVSPGGPAQRPLFEASLYTHAPWGQWDAPWKWMTYESEDAQAAAYRSLLEAMRAVAAKHGSVLPLTGELKDM